MFDTVKNSKGIIAFLLNKKAVLDSICAYP